MPLTGTEITTIRVNLVLLMNLTFVRHRFPTCNSLRWVDASVNKWVDKGVGAGWR